MGRTGNYLRQVKYRKRHNIKGVYVYMQRDLAIALKTYIDDYNKRCPEKTKALTQSKIYNDCIRAYLKAVKWNFEISGSGEN